MRTVQLCCITIDLPLKALLFHLKLFTLFFNEFVNTFGQEVVKIIFVKFV